MGAALDKGEFVYLSHRFYNFLPMGFVVYGGGADEMGKKADGIISVAPRKRTSRPLNRISARGRRGGASPPQVAVSATAPTTRSRHADSESTRGSPQRGADGPPGLTLITCGGAFDRGVRSYEDNIVVRAAPALSLLHISQPTGPA